LVILNFLGDNEKALPDLTQSAICNSTPNESSDDGTKMIIDLTPRARQQCKSTFINKY